MESHLTGFSSVPLVRVSAVCTSGPKLKNYTDKTCKVSNLRQTDSHFKQMVHAFLIKIKHIINNTSRNPNVSRSVHLNSYCTVIFFFCHILHVTLQEKQVFFKLKACVKKYLNYRILQHSAIQLQTSPHRVCGGQSSIATCFSLNISVL
jgi:hypothetical protein